MQTERKHRSPVVDRVLEAVAAVPCESVGTAGPAAVGRHAVSVREVVVLFGVMAVTFALRFYLLGQRSLWFDEAFSLDLAGRSFRNILAFLRIADAHPLGYYAFLAVWIRWFGTGLAEARFPSLVFGLAAVFLTWRIGRAVFSPVVGIIAAALVALNPFQIIAANEIRMYTLLECLALISTWIVWRAGQSPTARWWWIAYGLSAAAMAYTSYYSFVLIPAQVVWAWLSRWSRGQVIANLCVAAGVAILCYLPWIPYLLAVRGRGVPWRQSFEPGYVLSIAAAQTFGGYLFHVGNYQEVGVPVPLQYPLLLVLPFLVVLCVGAVLLDRTHKAAARLVILSWACPLLFIVLGSVAQGQIAAFPRHLVFLEPFAALLLAGGIVQLWRHVPANPAVKSLTACVLIAAFGYPAVAQFNPAFQHYRYDLAAGLVASRYQTGDAIVYFPEGTDLAFRYYFSAPGPQLRVMFDRNDWSRAAFQPAIRKVADAVGASGGGRVWLVYGFPWPRGSLNDLVQALAKRNYRPGPSWDFRGLWVTLLSR